MGEYKPFEYNSKLRLKIHEIIFGTHTPAGKAFDLVLLILILISVFVVILESIKGVRHHYDPELYFIEWVFTIFFTIEYLLRIYCSPKPRQYVWSFYGVIDLLAILPTYLSVVFVGSQYLLTIRALRLLRIFRILKIARFMKESRILISALRSSRTKISIFLFSVLIIVIFVGSAMYVVEGSSNENFDSIPRSMYWAIVTITTVGYGDITPQSAIGQFLSAGLMIIGYAIIAVPTGIVTVELTREQNRGRMAQITCTRCDATGHNHDAIYCRCCAERLPKA